MSAQFRIDVEPERDLVRIWMSGFFTHEDIAAFLAARAQAHGELRCAPNQHVTLTDLRGMKIQSREMVDAFQQMLADPAYRSRRLAFVAESTLARSQLGRALGSRVARVFETMAEAESWLAAAPASRAA